VNLRNGTFNPDGDLLDSFVIFLKHIALLRPPYVSASDNTEEGGQEINDDGSSSKAAQLVVDDTVGPISACQWNVPRSEKNRSLFIVYPGK
jgi:hypothetical protein